MYTLDLVEQVDKITALREKCERAALAEPFTERAATLMEIVRDLVDYSDSLEAADSHEKLNPRTFEWELPTVRAENALAGRVGRSW